MTLTLARATRHTTRHAFTQATRKPHASHTQATRNPHAIHTQSTRNPHAIHTQSTRNPHAIHTQSTRKSPQVTRKSHASHTQVTRKSHAIHTQVPSHTQFSIHLIIPNEIKKILSNRVEHIYKPIVFLENYILKKLLR
jgi:ubiquitin